MLRTVTFSDPRVAALVNARFVSAWDNRAPYFHDGDYAPESKIFAGAGEAFATKNICTFVLTPDGSVFHYVAGHLAPALFLDFLHGALAMRDAAFDRRMRLKVGGLDALREIHAERANRFATARPEGIDLEQSYRGARHVHNERCAASLATAYDYYARLHRYWSQVPVLPPLAVVRFAYLYGDNFTEETEDAKQIAEDPSVPRIGFCKMD